MHELLLNWGIEDPHPSSELFTDIRHEVMDVIEYIGHSEVELHYL